MQTRKIHHILMRTSIAAYRMAVMGMRRNRASYTRLRIQLGRYTLEKHTRYLVESADSVFWNSSNGYEEQQSLFHLPLSLAIPIQTRKTQTTPRGKRRPGL